jgi:hypothetical protein
MRDGTQCAVNCALIDHWYGIILHSQLHATGHDPADVSGLGLTIVGFAMLLGAMFFMSHTMSLCDK